MTNDELYRLYTTIKSVAVDTSIAIKDVKAIKPAMNDSEIPLLLLEGYDSRDKRKKRVLLTDYSLFIITSRWFRSPLVKVIPRTSIHDILEKRGIFFTSITMTLDDSVIKLNNVYKKASAKLMAIWNGEHISDPTQKISKRWVSILQWTTAIVVGLIIAKNIPDKPKFIPVYTVVEEENLTLYGVPRYEQRISVPLGLSEEELKQNLLAAAWKLQKEKNAVAVVIFAFRGDDMQRDGGYTAGKCTIAPNGIWADAMNVRSPSNLREEIIISEAYFDNTPIRANGSKAFIYNTLLKANGASLHKIDAKQAYTEDVISELKNGTEVTIIGNKREFTMYGPLDMYKVQVKGARKAARIGWVYGSDLSDTPNGKKVKIDMN